MLYILLGAAAVTMLTIRCSRGRMRSTVAQFLLTGAAIGFGDWLFNQMFPLYTYHPGLLTGRPDNFLGELMADVLFVPAMFSSLMPVGSRWKWLWAVLLVVPQAVLEVSFRRLGLFIYHGWSLWLTIGLFSTYFAGVTWYVERFHQDGYRPWHRAVLIFASTDMIYHAWEVLASGILELWWLRPGLVTSATSDRALGVVLFHGLPLMAVAFVAVWNGWARTLPGMAAVAAIMSLWLLAAEALGIFHVRPGWSPVYSALVLALLTWAVGRLDLWFLARQDERAGTPV